MRSSKHQVPITRETSKTNFQTVAGGARHSMSAVVCLAKPGTHGVTRPTWFADAWSFSGCWSLGFGGFR
jgi:hypothetical protein